MANLNAPFGLAPLRSLQSDKYNGAGSRYFIPSTDSLAYYMGDLVLSAANADTNGVSAVIKATAGTETYRGVIIGVENPAIGAVSIQGNPLSLETTNIPATKAYGYYVYVVDDPLVLFKCQADATATNQTAANANKNCNFTITAGSPAAPSVVASATVIASSSIATTSSFSGKLMGLLQVPNNTFGAYSIYQVKLNLHEFYGATAGV